MIPHDPFKAGAKKLSAALLNQIVRELMERGVWSVDGADFAEGVTGRTLSIPAPEVELWAMLTGEGSDDGSSASGGNAGDYAWQEVERRSKEVWTVVPSGRSGTEERDPARDINGTTGIPVGTIVRLSKGHASFVNVTGTLNPVGTLNQEWIFDHCCPDDGSAGASGDIEDECCIATETSKCINNNLVTTTTYTRIRVVGGKIECKASAVPCGQTAGTRYACVDGTQCMEDPNGAYASIEECQAACGIIAGVTYNCVEDASGKFNCVDPGDGTGQYPTLAACQEVCVNPCTGTCSWIWIGGKWRPNGSNCSTGCGCIPPPDLSSTDPVTTATTLCLSEEAIAAILAARDESGGKAIGGGGGTGDFGTGAGGHGGGGPFGP